MPSHRFPRRHPRLTKCPTRPLLIFPLYPFQSSTSIRANLCRLTFHSKSLIVVVKRSSASVNYFKLTGATQRHLHTEPGARSTTLTQPQHHHRQLQNTLRSIPKPLPRTRHNAFYFTSGSAFLALAAHRSMHQRRAPCGHPQNVTKRRGKAPAQ